MSARASSEDVEFGVRLGWLSKGLLFVVIGLLGLDIARRGFSSDDADQSGALAVIAGAPAGSWLVGIVAFGLLLFALWQFWSAAVADSEHLLDIARRIGTIGLGLSYLLLSASGMQIALADSTAPGGSGEEGAASPETIAAFLLGAPGGRLALALIGIGTVGVGGYHLWKGVTRRFLDDIDDQTLDEPIRTPLIALGIAGFIARALMLGIAGWLFISAAWSYDPNDAAGLDESLRALASVPFGRSVIAAASCGLVAAGAYDALTFRRQRLA